MRKNPELIKCGYEHQVQMKNGMDYSLELNGSEATARLNLIENVFSMVEFKNVDLGKHDFLDMSVLFGEKVSIRPYP